MMDTTAATTYELCLPGKTFLLLPLGAFALAGAGVATWGLLSTSPTAPPWFMGLFLLAIAALQATYVFTTPHRILVAADGTVAFVSVLRTKHCHLSEVHSIQPQTGQLGFFVVDYGRARQRLLAQFTGFHQFVVSVKAANPQVLIRGC